MLCGIIPPTFACILVKSLPAREVPASIRKSFKGFFLLGTQMPDNLRKYLLKIA